MFALLCVAVPGLPTAPPTSLSLSKGALGQKENRMSQKNDLDSLRLYAPIPRGCLPVIATEIVLLVFSMVMGGAVHAVVIDSGFPQVSYWGMVGIVWLVVSAVVARNDSHYRAYLRRNVRGYYAYFWLLRQDKRLIYGLSAPIPESTLGFIAWKVPLGGWGRRRPKLLQWQLRANGSAESWQEVRSYAIDLPFKRVFRYSLLLGNIYVVLRNRCLSGGDFRIPMTIPEALLEVHLNNPYRLAKMYAEREEYVIRWNQMQKVIRDAAVILRSHKMFGRSKHGELLADVLEEQVRIPRPGEIWSEELPDILKEFERRKTKLQAV